jgi:hypothetical protein
VAVLTLSGVAFGAGIAPDGVEAQLEKTSEAPMSSARNEPLRGVPIHLAW